MIKSILKRVYSIFLKMGLNPRVTLNFILSFPIYIKEFLSFYFKQKSSISKFKINLNPQLNDRLSNAGNVKSYYFWQDLLVAKKIIENGIKVHFDIGSRIDGFIGHLAASGVKVNVFDIRKFDDEIPNVIFNQLDFMNHVPEKYISCCKSISCLHTLEHFGLGRYGDKIDPDGHIKGINQISKILKKDGILYLSVPVGFERVEFNAHRVFDIKSFYKILEDKFNLLEFILIDENCNVSSFYNLEENQFPNLNYGCGIYILKKK
jgi:hypothetical protein